MTRYLDDESRAGRRIHMARFPSDCFKPVGDKCQRWREIGRDALTPAAQMHLEWIIFYSTSGKRNASVTAAYFGISRKTLHKYLSRFDETDLRSLEERSRAPHRKRQRTITTQEEDRIIGLRKQSKCKRGKKKLQRNYWNKYRMKISTDKIQQTIDKFHLFPNRAERQAQIKKNKRKRKEQAKIRIHQFEKKEELGYLWHTDTVVIYWNSQRRVIFTAIEDQTKIAYARIYQSGSSRSGKDFLERLIYLSNHQIVNAHHDNGVEFEGEFEKACEQLGIQQVYSRVRRPKDNPVLERFNRTIQEEWLEVSEVGLDGVQQANLDLTEWLVDYNFDRPHQSLDYQSPIEYATLRFPVSPMWAASTGYCFCNPRLVVYDTMSKKVLIGDKLIGDGHPCFIVGEIGINHNGSVDIAKGLIDVAANVGADAVKFQKRTVKVVYTKEELDRPRESVFGTTNRDLKVGLELGLGQYRKIDRYARKRGIIWFASPWDEASVDFLEKFNVPAYKVASASLTDHNLLKYIKATGKPIILSTGMSTMREIDKAVEVLGDNRLILLHCVSTYPSEDKELNLAVINTLKERFGVPVGYSGHEKGVVLSVVSAVMGANLVERHITLDRSMWGSDQSASLEPKGFEILVRDVRRLKLAKGDGVKKVFDSELPVKAKLRRKG